MVIRVMGVLGFWSFRACMAGRAIKQSPIPCMSTMRVLLLGIGLFCCRKGYKSLYS